MTSFFWEGGGGLYRTFTCSPCPSYFVRVCYTAAMRVCALTRHMAVSLVLLLDTDLTRGEIVGLTVGPKFGEIEGLMLGLAVGLTGVLTVGETAGLVAGQLWG